MLHRLHPSRRLLLLPLLRRGSTTTTTTTTSTISTRNLATTRPLHKDSIIPSSLKHTAKAIDHVASAAAIKGIEAGETIASVARSAIPKFSSSSSSSSSSRDQPIGSDMYGEQDLRPDSPVSEAGSTASGATPKRVAQEATGDVNDVLGRAKDVKEEAKAQARKIAGDAKGKMS
ncbi:hypothetical protein L211DRAFT_867067 [Terfezia boudieri ATCC MYA-4762]|uniref:SMP domain-containing protein n=1 Tax=Terfezia boudieri ATCC MYA-4762 TaxID=1051890 RepID=A0A3N4LRJ7_9PEZI|nr:hypothetical protein L211DRAFT_867067 [Terfezia boudieri ATCC MYA-4762]